ncbi:unnamed protein product [Gulo gulo]|uniref:Uncharacterized protein n=1 Tax=Gulo gulo TaxID=48420 RepID=A0A9X9LPE2_GULGU|nr:unnamed protein product [Gulo gulo]
MWPSIFRIDCPELIKLIK